MRIPTLSRNQDFRLRTRVHTFEFDTSSMPCHYIFRHIFMVCTFRGSAIQLEDLCVDVSFVDVSFVDVSFEQLARDRFASIHQLPRRGLLGN
jgi:hypothetical protein